MIRYLLRMWSAAALKERGYRCLDNEAHTGLVVLMDSYASGLNDPRCLPIEIALASHLPEIHFTAHCAAIPSRSRVDVGKALHPIRTTFPEIMFTMAPNGWVCAALWLSLWDDVGVVELDDSVRIGRAFDHFYYAICCAHEALDLAGLLPLPNRTSMVVAEACAVVRGAVARES